MLVEVDGGSLFRQQCYPASRRECGGGAGVFVAERRIADPSFSVFPRRRELKGLRKCKSSCSAVEMTSSGGQMTLAMSFRRWVELIAQAGKQSQFMPMVFPPEIDL